MVSWHVHRKRNTSWKILNALGVAADTMVVSIGALIRAVLIISLVSADYRRTSIGMNRQHVVSRCYLCSSARKLREMSSTW